MSKKIPLLYIFFTYQALYSIFFSKENIFYYLKLKKDLRSKEVSIKKIEDKIEMIQMIESMFEKNQIDQDFIEEFLKLEINNKKKGEVLIKQV